MKKECVRVASVNLGFHGSTGAIMRDLKKRAETYGFHHQIASPAEKSEIVDSDMIRLCGLKTKRYNSIACVLSGLDGCFAWLSTLRYLRKLKCFQPDILHLHNLHYGYINLPLLFRFIKRNRVAVVWTLHDCWSFTGHCPHFVYENCQKWKNGCFNCPRYKEYPRTIFDNSKFMWKRKKNWFTGVPNMTLVTPSKWLGDMVSQSFLQEYPRQVIHNGIDLSVFRPVASDFRAERGLLHKKVVLGIAFAWDEKKGLDVFVELTRRLGEEYAVVLVGVDDYVSKSLPDNICAISRTKNREELAAIYSAADVFVNPTREDTFPTVNLEANACGTPVITFQTGGSPECISSDSGSVVKYNDIDALEREIRRICTDHPFTADDCIKSASRFDRNERLEEYIRLYEAIRLERNQGN